MIRAICELIAGYMRDNDVCLTVAEIGSTDGRVHHARPASIVGRVRRVSRAG
jgi:hypothetical protein